MLVAKVKDKKLMNKCDISGCLNNSDLDNKIKTLAAKSSLIAEQDKIVKLTI